MNQDIKDAEKMKQSEVITDADKTKNVQESMEVEHKMEPNQYSSFVGAGTKTRTCGSGAQVFLIPVTSTRHSYKYVAQLQTITDIW